MKAISIKSTIISFIVLMIFWYIMSGFFDIIHTLMGVISVSIVLAVNHQYKKHKFFEDETDVVNDLRYFYVPLYTGWLLLQMIISAFQVAKVLLTPGLPIKPQIIRFRVNLPNAHAKMILGNSISLTPGTLTLQIEGDDFIVHSLIPSAHEGIIDDSMPHQVLKLFSKELHPVVSDVEIIEDKEQL